MTTPMTLEQMETEIRQLEEEAHVKNTASMMSIFKMAMFVGELTPAELEAVLAGAPKPLHKRLTAIHATLLEHKRALSACESLRERAGHLRFELTERRAAAHASRKRSAGKTRELRPG